MEGKERFLEVIEGLIVLQPYNLDGQEEAWALEEGYKKCSQWCITSGQPEVFFIKGRHNESESHAYLCSAIHQLIVEGIDPEAKLLATRDADIVFRIKGKRWAIEVETGTVYKKSKKKLQAKVNRLNRKYFNRWFFVITHRDLRKKYRHFGKVMERKEIISKIYHLSD